LLTILQIIFNASGSSSKVFALTAVSIYVEGNIKLNCTSSGEEEIEFMNKLGG
jgi:hypothetical protein